MSWFGNRIFRTRALPALAEDAAAEFPWREPGPPLIVLMPHAAGLASYQVQTFPDSAAAQRFFEDRFRGPVERGVAAFWALTWEPDFLPGDARAEPVVIIRDASRPGVVYSFSFVDMEAAMDFLRGEFARGLDLGLVRVYWGVALSIGVDPPASGGRVTLTPQAPPVRPLLFERLAAGLAGAFGGPRPTGWLARSEEAVPQDAPPFACSEDAAALARIERLLDEDLDLGLGAETAPHQAGNNGTESGVCDPIETPAGAAAAEADMGRVVREIDQVLEGAGETAQAELRLDELISEMESLLAEATREVAEAEAAAAPEEVPCEDSPAPAEPPAGVEPPRNGYHGRSAPLDELATVLESTSGEPAAEPLDARTPEQAILDELSVMMDEAARALGLTPAAEPQASRPDPLSRQGVRNPVCIEGREHSRQASDGSGAVTFCRKGAHQDFQPLGREARLEKAPRAGFRPDRPDPLSRQGVLRAIALQRQPQAEAKREAASSAPATRERVKQEPLKTPEAKSTHPAPGQPPAAQTGIQGDKSAQDSLDQFAEYVAQMRRELARFRKVTRWQRHPGDFQGFDSPPGRF